MTLKTLFRPRLGFLFTVVAATVMYLNIEPWNWSSLVPYMVVWACGIITGFLDAKYLEDDQWQ